MIRSTLKSLGAASDHDYLFRISGSAIRFLGYLIVYEESRDEDQQLSDDEGEARIPAGISEGQVQRLVQLLPEQHFTQPPPRYSEANLVRTLEENSIGRPSTYAPILGVIQQRGYVIRDGKRLIPTETGFTVCDLLVEHFPDVMSLGFTAQMETDLDLIAAGEMEWVNVVREFYGPFSRDLAIRRRKNARAKHGSRADWAGMPYMRERIGYPLGSFRQVYQLQRFPGLSLH